MPIQNVVQRNIQILQDALNGQDMNSLAKKHHITTINPCILNALSILNRYGADIPVSAGKESLLQHKSAILKAIANIRVPKTTISDNVHQFLQERFGDDYPRKVKEISKKWESELDYKFSAINHTRERNCLLQWLASEGCYVGDYIDEKYQEILFNILCGHLVTLDTNGTVQVTIEKAQISPWSKSKVLVDFKISDEKTGMCATRKMEIGVL